MNAHELVNAVKKANTFCAVTAAGKPTAVNVAQNFQPAAEALQAAVEALEASAAAGGAQSVKELIDALQPTNAEGVEYDAPEFEYFGRDDYVAYTYENYQAARSDAWDLVEDAKVYVTEIDPETGEEFVPDWENFSYAPVDALSVAYAKHRLNLYADRLIRTPNYKTNLNRAVNEANAANYVADDYEAESWATYQRALAFATSVNNESAPRQTKINEAYIQLIEAQKRLMKVAGDIIEEIIINLAGANPGNSEYAVESVVVGGVNLLLGVFPEANVADVASYFDITGDATVECESIATGSVVTIYDANDEVLAEYTLVITGDVTADGAVSVVDLSTFGRVLGGAASWDGVATSAASDLDASGDTSVLDMSAISRVLAGAASINYASRTVS